MSAIVRRRPFRGCFGGALLLLGVVLLLFVYGVIALSVWYLLAAIIAGAVLGLVLAYLAPVRGRQAPSPYGVMAPQPAGLGVAYPDLPPATPAPSPVPPVSAPSAPAAWLVDPADPAFLRYWDGRQWTEFRSPR
ncbi:MAG: DUF2510 domain-containing protein [Actinomycetes bacterium]